MKNVDPADVFVSISEEQTPGDRTQIMLDVFLRNTFRYSIGLGFRDIFRTASQQHLLHTPNKNFENILIKIGIAKTVAVRLNVTHVFALDTDVDFLSSDAFIRFSTGKLLQPGECLSLEDVLSVKK
ncbi:hypothetical protein [Microcystis phage Mel-JY01]